MNYLDYIKYADNIIWRAKELKAELADQDWQLCEMLVAHIKDDLHELETFLNPK